MLKVLDLFSGIGGFSYGLEKTGGFETIAFCEIDKHARKVLTKHWPNVKQYEDITELTYEKLQKDNLIPEVISGGFPCQDISVAGKQAGIIGKRSGLWSEFARLIKDVRPKWAIIENVSALKSKGLTLVLQDLAEIGYNAEWHCIPCSALGGLHRRDRVWIIAYPMANANRFRTLSRPGEIQKENGEIPEWDNHAEFNNTSERARETSMEDSRCSFGQGSLFERENAEKIARRITNQLERSSSTSELMDYSDNTSSKGNGSTFGIQEAYPNIDSSSSNEPQQIIGRQELELFAQYAQIFWTVESSVGRVVNGLPNRLHRLRQLGNSVVPQIPEFLGHCILNWQEAINEANRR